MAGDFDRVARRGVNRPVPGHTPLPLLHHDVPLRHDAFRPVARGPDLEGHQPATEISPLGSHLHAVVEHSQVKVRIREVRPELEFICPHLRRLALAWHRACCRTSPGEQQATPADRT